MRLTLCPFDRIARQAVGALRPLEDRVKLGEPLVDRASAQLSFGNQALAIRLDLLRCDLVERRIGTKLWQ